MKNRLDTFVKNKFMYSRDYSKEIIKKGYVFVDGNIIKKPSFEITDNSIVEIDELAIPKYVSRAGNKLEKAITEFNLDLKDKICLDIGSSTGGFCDCMLQQGATKIYAIDTGTLQLHNKLLNDMRVISFENTDIRNFTINEKVDLITIDVSFISVTKLIYKLSEFTTENSCIIVLIKPQFEAGRENVSKCGVVRDKKIHIKVIKNIDSIFSEFNLYINKLTFSPITGSKGNIEYLAQITGQKCNSNYNINQVVDEAFSLLNNKKM